ncbi:hypothetical protein SEA_RIZWANA_96 [Arthrobacter phage Rizwana]|nr:hypothetical protein SEA_RIZWANA_96 [Arthrobacter phage Rizwana]
MLTRKELRERRHRALLILNDLYRETPWYLLAERSMIREAMRSAGPVAS